jgi:hypothetical protein
MGIQRILAIVISGGLLLLILELVRRKRLMERYALLWLFSTLLLLVLSLWSGLLNSLASALGVSYPPSALFAVAFGVVLVLLVHFSLAVSHLSDQNKVLAQRLGILQRQVQEQNEQLIELAHQDGSLAAVPRNDEPAGTDATRERERLTPTR